MERYKIIDELDNLKLLKKYNEYSGSVSYSLDKKNSINKKRKEDYLKLIVTMGESLNVIYLDEYYSIPFCDITFISKTEAHNSKSIDIYLKSQPYKPLKFMIIQ